MNISDFITTKLNRFNTSENQEQLLFCRALKDYIHKFTNFIKINFLKFFYFFIHVPQHGLKSIIDYQIKSLKT